MSVESPCVRMCTLDGSGAMCLGCYRTLDEICTWSQLTDPARTQVLRRIEDRRRAYDRRNRPAQWTESSCQACGVIFSCGAGDPATPCWCASQPALVPLAPGARCLCPGCLAATAPQEERWENG